MCMYECMYMYIHMICRPGIRRGTWHWNRASWQHNIYMYINICTCTCVYMYAYICKYTHTYIHIFVRIYIIPRPGIRRGTRHWNRASWLHKTQGCYSQKSTHYQIYYKDWLNSWLLKMFVMPLSRGNKKPRKWGHAQNLIYY